MDSFTASKAGAETEMESAKPIEVLPVGAFLASEFEQVPDIVPGLIPGFGLAGLAGAPKTGKTNLGLALCAATLTGGDFLGLPTRRTRTLFIGEEGGLAKLQSRLKTMMAAFPAAEQADSFLGIAMRQGVRLDTPADLARLDAAVTAARPGLVILDCLVRMHRLAENDARDMASLMENLEGLAGRHRCTVLFLHHVAKMSEEGGRGYSMRGSGVLASSTEANLILRRTRTGTRLDGQLRDDRDVHIDLQFDPLTLLFRRVMVSPKKARGRPSREELLSVLNTNPDLTMSQMAASLSTSDTTLRPVIAALVESKEVMEFRAPRGRGRIYRLAA
jgi:RecA-family ATPase